MHHQTDMRLAGYSTRRGTVVLDEIIYYIQHFALAQGLLHINATAPGPAKFPGGKTEFSVHGPDGILFLSAQEVEMQPFEVDERSFVHSDFTIVMEGKIGHPISGRKQE
jgi:hypothetical protein